MSYFSYANAGSGPSLTPPPTPCHKRSRDDFEQQSNTIKRAQFHQIHSQAHLSTVAMMMEASRQQKYLPTMETIESECDLNEPVSTPQKPFWPMVVRVRQT